MPEPKITAKSSAMNAWIEAETKTKLPQKGPFRIGRHSSNDFVLHAREASRFHAVINSRPQGCWLIDLGSDNGTWHKGIRLLCPVLLRDGDEFRIGSFHWCFHQAVARKKQAEHASDFYEQTTLRADDMLVASDQGAILLDASFNVLSKSPDAQRLLVEFLSFSAVDSDLPRELKAWLTTGKLKANPLVIQLMDKRLTIRAATAGSTHHVLHITKEASVFSERALAPYHLTARETEVLSWLIAGKRNDDIAVILDLNVRTVEKHIERIYEKLGVESRAGAIKSVLRQTTTSL